MVVSVYVLNVPRWAFMCYIMILKKKDLNILWKKKMPQIASPSLKLKSKRGELAKPDFKHVQSSCNKNSLKHPRIDTQTSGTDCRGQADSCTYRNLICIQGGFRNQWGRYILFDVVRKPTDYLE